MSNVNYIHHLNNFYIKTYQDKRLSPHHISLYMAAFQMWNIHRFQNPISINREEMMTLSKIGSTNTYTKVIKDLDQWGYLRYEPSYNPLKGSRLHLYRFDKAGDKGEEKVLIKVVRPYIKHNKPSKKINTHVDQNKNYDEPL